MHYDSPVMDLIINDFAKKKKGHASSITIIMSNI